MDDHLVALSGGAGIDPAVKGRLREQRQRVRLLLGQRGRFRGNLLYVQRPARVPPGGLEPWPT